MDKDKKIRELEEKGMDKDTYIEELEGTIKDMKMGLYTISLMDNINPAIELSEQMLNEFYESSGYTKLTTLQKGKLRTKDLEKLDISNTVIKMDLLNITTLHEISETYKIPVPTLKTRLTLSSFNLIKDIDYRRMGRGQSIIFTPIGVEKVIKKGWGK